MKLKSSMSFVIPVIIIFIVLSFLVALFAIQNNEMVKLRYKIPYTPFQFPAEVEPGQPNYFEIHVVFVILLSILLGIAIMTVFVVFAGIGWRYYVLTNKSRERKERKIIWDHRERAIALSLLGFHQYATEQFEHIIDKENPHIELYVGLAEAYERQGEYQRAIENYNSILTRYPENMRALFGAANNWEALGNYTDAIKLYNRVLDVDRSSPRANQKIQALLEKSGQYAEAIEAYQRTKNSQDPQKTQEILASLYYRQAVRQIKAGDLKTAERTLKESRREYDFYVPNMLILANLYLNTGREREAERLLEITAEHSLSTIIFRRLEEYYYSQEGEPAEKFEPVIDLYKNMIETHDANHLRLALGKLYLKLEKYDEAEQMFLQFQSKDSSIPQVHLLLADLYHQIGNIDKALEEYRFSAELVDIKIADFKCYHCGAMYEYWADQCSSCKSWGTIEDLFYTKGPQSVLPELKQRPLPQLSTSRPEDEEEKVVSVS
jgi:tetratricopeptide (TPR) repeat protein